LPTLDLALVLFVEEVADLDGVVGQDPEPAPGLSAVETVDEGSSPPVGVFEVGDPPFRSGAPFDETDETAGPLHLLTGDAGPSLTGNRHLGDTEVLQSGFDFGFA
jgi:hypothetical protein